MRQFVSVPVGRDSYLETVPLPHEEQEKVSVPVGRDSYLESLGLRATRRRFTSQSLSAGIPIWRFTVEVKEEDFRLSPCRQGFLSGDYEKRNEYNLLSQSLSAGIPIWSAHLK